MIWIQFIFRYLNKYSPDICQNVWQKFGKAMIEIFPSIPAFRNKAIINTELQNKRNGNKLNSDIQTNRH